MIDWPGQAGVGPEEDRRTAREVSALSSSPKRSGVGCILEGELPAVRYVVSIICG